MNDMNTKLREYMKKYPDAELDIYSTEYENIEDAFVAGYEAGQKAANDIDIADFVALSKEMAAILSEYIKFVLQKEKPPAPSKKKRSKK